jgi:Asp-tRNA(Asn)/Glu-tRNA(Gln) amidotransferase A subunit family amidase
VTMVNDTDKSVGNSIPAGTTGSGTAKKNIGMQLIGPHFSEGVLIRVALAIEQRADEVIK